MSTGIVLVVRITIDMGTVLASTKVVAMNRKYSIELTCRYGTYLYYNRGGIWACGRMPTFLHIMPKRVLTHYAGIMLEVFGTSVPPH